jgi:photosystem II stability/assembly factor-like uncharacterized protein
MADTMSGWLFGRSALWKTHDGGVTWDAAHSPDLGVGDSFSGRLVGRDSGFLLTTLQRLYETKDGGIRWAAQSLPHFDGNGQSVWSDGERVWLGGGEYVSSAEPDAPNYAVKPDGLGRWKVLDPVVFRREGAGSAWEKQHLPTGAWMIVELRFWNRQRGVAVGDTCLYYTESGGDRWSLGTFRDGSGTVVGCPGEGGREALFLEPNSGGWLSVDDGSVYRTVDGGKDWHRVSVPGTPHFDVLAFADAKRGFGIARESQLYESLDAGRTWKRQGVGFLVRSVYLLDRHTGWLTSDLGLYRIQ